MKLSLFQTSIVEFITTCKAERNISEHTARAYKADLEHFSSFWQVLVSQEQQEPSFAAALERYIIVLYHRKISKPTIARKISCFTSFARFMQRVHQQDLPLALHRPRLDKKLPVFLTVDEITFLLDQAPITQEISPFPERDKAILELLYATGIRCSELIAIQLKDVDFTQNTIIVQGKRKKERVVIFGNTCHDRLRHYLKHERKAAEDMYEYLFLNYKDQQLTTRSIQRICGMFSQFLSSGKRITPHVLRHSCATHLLQRGASLVDVQRLLGHESLATTERYTHVSLAELTSLCETNHPLSAHNSSKAVTS